MKIVLVIAIMFASGENATMGAGYPTMESCEVALISLPLRVAHHNATDENKIAQFAATCVELKRAPQGNAT